MRTANKNCRPLVNSRTPFTANNLFAERHGEDYFVFSYGHHWILFAYVDGIWYENKDKYSVSTSRHHSQAHPLCETTKLSHEDIMKLYQGAFFK